MARGLAGGILVRWSSLPPSLSLCGLWAGARVAVMDQDAVESPVAVGHDLQSSRGPHAHRARGSFLPLSSGVLMAAGAGRPVSLPLPPLWCLVVVLLPLWCCQGESDPDLLVVLYWLLQRPAVVGCSWWRGGGCLGEVSGECFE